MPKIIILQNTNSHSAKAMQKQLDSKLVNSGANYSSYDSRDTPQLMDKKFTTMRDLLLLKEQTLSELRV